MKRQRNNIVNQPAVKKPDISASTDFRSQIGAKLQTLLNGFTPGTRLTTKSKRQLYADLFGETQHSQIIIDPTIVIKSEPDEEECSNDPPSFNSRNFILSAKSRITELLNKKHDDANKHTFKDNEKENSLSINECGPTSSRQNSSSTQTKAQALLNNSFTKKRKISSSRDNSAEPAVNRLKKSQVVVVEDVRDTDSTKCSSSLPTNHIENKNCFSNIDSNSGSTLSVSEESMDLAVKDHATDEEPNSIVTIPDVECVIEDSINISESSSEPHISTDDHSDNNPLLNVSKSKSPKTTKTSNTTPAVVPVGDIPFEETTNQFSSSNADDSELVDDPSTHQAVLGIASNSGLSKSRLKIHEPEVVLVCVKRPIHEVITIEDDDDDSDDIIEEVHECVQCGKAFRAKSLLNFHLRMHGNVLSTSSSSSSQSCIA